MVTLFKLSEVIFAWICMFITITRLTIPYKDIQEMYYTREVHKFPWMIFIVTLFDATFWASYWYFVDNIYFKILAYYGLCITLIFLTAFISFHDHLSFSEKLIRYVATYSIFPIVFFSLINSGFDPIIIGLFPLGSNCLVYVSPLQKLKKCIEEKDNSYLPIKIILVNLISSTLYLFFIGIYCYDIITFFPQALAFVLSNTQLYFWNKYKKEQETIKNNLNLSLEEISNERSLSFKENNNSDIRKMYKAVLLNDFNKDEVNFKKNRSMIPPEKKLSLIDFYPSSNVFK